MVHKTKNRHWLTESNPEKVYQLHHVDDLINGDKRLNILEIGAGSGDSPRFLSKKHDVTVVDIVPEAFENLSCKTVLTEDFIREPVDSQDLILSHLVIQHCYEDMVKYLISCSLRCLRPGGFFSFQFSYFPGEPSKALEDFFEKEWLRFYSLEEMTDTVEDYGGVFVNTYGPVVHPEEYNIHWYIMHCMKE